ncbi:MAG: hypothetical protein ACOCRK_10360 [bacterium]
MNYEKAWAFFKEDLKDIIGHTEKFDIYDETKCMANRLLFQMETYEEQIDKKVEITDYRLKGWDYTELLKKFNQIEFEGVDYGSLAVEDVCSYNQVLHFLQDNWLDDNYKPNKKVVNVVKEYLRKMSRDEDKADHYDAVWQGMLNIKDDYVFMQFVFALLSHMWT